MKDDQKCIQKTLNSCYTITRELIWAPKKINDNSQLIKYISDIFASKITNQAFKFEFVSIFSWLIT